MVMLRLTAEQYRRLPLLVDESTCAGKTYIITGGNSGLGFETAKHLVECSAACVVLGVRNMKAGDGAKQEIESATGRRDVVKVWHIDMASHKSVQEFARRASDELGRIDGCVANAGIMIDQFSLVEGAESSVTVNVVNTILLGLLMMPKLQACAREHANRPTLVFIVSVLGYTVKSELDKIRAGNIFDNLNDQKNADMDARYPLTKLLEEFAARQLAALCPVEKTGVVINMVAPGLCSTLLGKEARTLTKVMHSLIKGLMARTPEVGSRTILHGLVAGEESHGKMLSGCMIKDYWVPDWVSKGDGEVFQQRFWNELTSRLEARQPGCVTQAMT